MPRSTDAPFLTIDGGIHASASVCIPVGEITVGPSAAEGIVVSDLPEGSTFALRWDGRTVRVSSLGRDLAVDGKSLDRGQSRRITRSVEVVSGGVPFRLELPSTGSGSTGAGSASPRRLRFGLPAGVVVATTAAFVASSAWPSVPRPMTGENLVSEGQSRIGAAIPRASAAKRSLADDLRDRVAAVKLDGISVEVQSDGAVTASGRIIPAKDEAWRETRRWFDAASEGRSVLIDRVAVTAAAAGLQVRAAYTGQPPYVIDENGDKLFVGSVLPDGSVIQKLEDRRVLLKRGDQAVVLRF